MFQFLFVSHAVSDCGWIYAYISNLAFGSSVKTRVSCGYPKIFYQIAGHDAFVNIAFQWARLPARAQWSDRL